jgi:hypothetical protein
MLAKIISFVFIELVQIVGKAVADFVQSQIDDYKRKKENEAKLKEINAEPDPVVRARRKRDFLGGM